MGALRGGRWVVFVGVAAALLSLAVGCGRGGGPTDPTAGQEGAFPAAGGPVYVAPPGRMEGYFTTARSHELWAAGSTQVIVPSWGDPIGAAAVTMRERGVWAMVSAHHCFGGPPAGWEECWAKTRAWMRPAEETGRVVGVYVVDEPLHNGVPKERVEAAIARVRADGYRVMVAETYARYAGGGRWVPPVDWFGLTAYETKPGWVADRYREEPRLNVGFASSDEAGCAVGAAGCFRWSLDMGAADRGRIVRLP